ncbi:hypothetical protein [Micromonospora sp. NPDC023633]|uniref:hypothetical protein n=1 Tax=Micromonospora sp. NPDC023633 TaxID=3154320 RepID=UPI0033E9CD4A
MAGHPQVRESALLYGPDPTVAEAMVRLIERMDGSGIWEVLLNSPARQQEPRRWERPDEAGARAVLESIYAEGEATGGIWRKTRHDGR